MRWWFSFFFFSVALHGTVLSSLAEQGYYEFESELSAAWYDDLYRQFDSLVEEYKENAHFRETLDRADREFGKSPPYGGYFMGMFLPERSKQPQLLFFRYCRKYRPFLKTSYPQLLEVPRLRNFLAKCEELLEIIDRYFFQMIALLQKEGIDTLPVLLGDREHLGTVLKIVHYEPSELGLGSHCDFSGLSLLLDHTDTGNEALVISPRKGAEFTLPKRQFSRGLSTSVLLIPGVALEREGIPLEPTAHAVRAVSRTRYAAIGFAMVPLKKTKSSVTQE